MTKYQRGWREASATPEGKIEHSLNLIISAMKDVMLDTKLLKIIKNCDNFDEFYKRSGVLDRNVAKEYWDEYWANFQ